MDRHSNAGDQPLSQPDLAGLARLAGPAGDRTPLIDGDTATFVWHGPRAPRLISDVNDWDPEHAPLLVEADPGVWTYVMRLPLDAYVEYAYVLDGQRILDPLNPRLTPNGTGQTNHYFYMPGAGPTPLAQRQRGVPHGVVSRYRVDTDGLALRSMRGVTLYQPPTSDAVPLVVVFDGQDYYRRARLPVIVDNLLAAGRIRPVALAMVDNSAPARALEYACSDITVSFLLRQVLPLASRELNLVDVEEFPGAFGICGASMGGLMALYAGLRVPQVFGHVLSQSGAFAFYQYDPVVVELVRNGPPRPLRIWMDAGRFEWLLPGNRALHALLVERGYDAAYRQFSAGHNYPAWRDDVSHGLEWLYGTSTLPGSE